MYISVVPDLVGHIKELPQFIPFRWKCGSAPAKHTASLSLSMFHGH